MRDLAAGSDVVVVAAAAKKRTMQSTNPAADQPSNKRTGSGLVVLLVS